MRRVARHSRAEATFTASSNSDVAERHLANHSLAVKGIWVDIVAPGVFHPDSHSGISGRLESVPNSQDGMHLLTEELEDTTSSDRLLFTTSGGMKGIGPSGTEAGDCLFVLAGGKLPFALRWSRQKQYRLVGECYVPGLMWGETTKSGYQSMRRCHPALSLQQRGLGHGLRPSLDRIRCTRVTASLVNLETLDVDTLLRLILPRLR
jgi:hypothetical protein